ncbi:MAG: DNA-directed RNA polymerase subunit B [Candidatus Micrarchaeia archaeon]
MTTKCSVFLNGRFVGFHENGDLLTKTLREKRRNDELDSEMNVSFYPKTNEVFINTDEGRARRPLVVVKNSKPLLKDEHVQKLQSGELSWMDLIKEGLVEYLDAEEEDNAFVALNEELLKKKEDKGRAKKYTHVEFDPSAILGFASAQIPFPEYNMAPRVLMAAQHTKQALGLYTSNFNMRTDTRGYLLFYPQKPIVQTRIYAELENFKRSSGQNFVVAVLSYKGFNMDDAVVMNKAAVERAIGRSAFFRSYSTQEQRYPGGQRDKFEIPEEYVQGYLGPDAYTQLDETGLIAPETNVKGEDVLVGKTSPPRFLKEVSALDVESEKRRESSVRVRGNESGIVDSVILSQTTSGNRFFKVRVRKTNIPEIGDKFASRFGQKGVISLLASPEDMPFTKEGIIPDLVINPHAIPGRMTAGHLLEMLAGKAACMDGKIKDGSAFTGESEDDFEKVLSDRGLKKTGQETLYEGESGKMMSAKIFVGVIYYQRLHHLVSLKMHARSRGPVQMLTHQPTEGRAREGGLRLGEMERDCFIGFGAASLLKERMIDSSDKTTELVCANCGSLAVYDKIKNRKFCPLCESSKVHEVEMSYAFKLLLDEMKSIGVFPKMKLAERG